MKNAVILPYYKAFQQDLGQIYPKNQIFTMARTRSVEVKIYSFISSPFLIRSRYSAVAQNIMSPEEFMAVSRES